MMTAVVMTKTAIPSTIQGIMMEIVSVLLNFINIIIIIGTCGKINGRGFTYDS